MPTGETMLDILQFGALGLLGLFLYLQNSAHTAALAAKDRQIETLTLALIDTKVNAKALELVTSLNAPILSIMQSLAASGAVKGALAFSEGKSERSGDPLPAAAAPTL